MIEYTYDGFIWCITRYNLYHIDYVHITSDLYVNRWKWCLHFEPSSWILFDLGVFTSRNVCDNIMDEFLDQAYHCPGKSCSWCYNFSFCQGLGSHDKYEILYYECTTNLY